MVSSHVDLLRRRHGGQLTSSALQHLEFAVDGSLRMKALINDQFQRLCDLCAQVDIPVWHWHGEVARSHKDRLMKHPSGILQITPESLEALLLHRHADLVRLFGDLRFIVIDEVHALMRGDRGAQDQ